MQRAKRWSIVLCAVAGLTLTSCSGSIQYMGETYDGVDAEKFAVEPKNGPRFVDYGNGPQDTARHFMVFDKISESKMMIWAHPGDAIVFDITKSMTGVDANPPIMVYRDVADEYFKSKKRICKATEAYAFDKYRYEVRYSCDNFKVDEKTKKL